MQTKQCEQADDREGEQANPLRGTLYSKSQDQISGSLKTIAAREARLSYFNKTSHGHLDLDSAKNAAPSLAEIRDYEMRAICRQYAQDHLLSGCDGPTGKALSDSR